jgi:D-alanine-D-alanine ligase
MSKIKIAIIAGGWSGERELSIANGKAVLDSLDREKYEVMMIDPICDLEWIFENRQAIDLAIIQLNGKNGNDGSVHGFLNHLKIPFVGSDMEACVLARNNKILKYLYSGAGLKIIKDVILKKETGYSIEKITDLLGSKTITKPIWKDIFFPSQISENGQELINAINEGFLHSDEIIIEKYLEGRNVNCIIIGNSNLDALPIIEVIYDNSFQYDVMYQGNSTKEICPAELPLDIKAKVVFCAKEAHRILGCRTWSRSDMIVVDNDVFVYETNLIPNLAKGGFVSLAVKAAGLSMGEFLDKLIDLSLGDARI